MILFISSSLLETVISHMFFTSSGIIVTSTALLVELAQLQLHKLYMFWDFLLINRLRTTFLLLPILLQIVESSVWN